MKASASLYVSGRFLEHLRSAHETVIFVFRAPNLYYAVTSCFAAKPSIWQTFKLSLRVPFCCHNQVKM